MPIYEYECQKCHHRLEAIQKFSDDPLTECPACKAPELKKLVSAAAFHLKGSGWYQTDFKGTTPSRKEEKKEPESCPAASSCSSGTCPATPAE
jgi:putative FmdB family regulatory protein